MSQPLYLKHFFADYNLLFWHHYFGWPTGSLNGFNIWICSGRLKAFLDGSFASSVDFECIISVKIFQRLWLAVSGLYPK